MDTTEKETLIKLQALDQFEALLNNKEFSDVKFVVEGKTIYANKVILISRSSVFSAMFRNPMKEAQESAVEITDIEYNVMLETLRFVYVAKVNEIEKFSKSLLATADKYDLGGLKEICTDHLCTKISVESVVEYLSLADLHNVRQLKEKAIKFIIDNGNAMVNRPEFDSIVDLHKGAFLEVVRAVLAREKIEDSRSSKSYKKKLHQTYRHVLLQSLKQNV
ncbi:speckle-type POZ protein-like [Nasonia vitripennis]|uniref:BTB domain-containing protein n=1 Tax=Nasonia vitripennis TaxID=7425 RepID=A0A7M7IMX5_NASVI|nr:speckle-type POZ protein-like [Nasonia vitripennis]XP_016839240.1 speckle-type POZ protein-like [Nasonia vitripennis]